MLKIFLKIIFSLTVLWFVILFTIYEEFKPNSILTSPQLFEKALQPFISNNKKNTMQFDAWKLLGEGSSRTLYKDKLSAIKNKEFPLGMLGSAVHVKDNIKGTMRMLIEKGWEDNAFNQFVSDLIPVDRTLPDLRNEWCFKRNLSIRLPEVTVVICFHNEAWSTLLRTIHSVINRSPRHLLTKIILVDDYSTKFWRRCPFLREMINLPANCARLYITDKNILCAVTTHLKNRLEEYIKKIPKIYLIRTQQREGLIRARIIAMKRILTPVAVFLDSHCECTEGWLEPLLERIAENPKTVVSPVIDHIDTTTFQYIPQDPEYLQIGGFNWNLKFIWRPIPHDIQAQRQHLFMPIKTPTIAGGLFAIDSKFFKDLGYYDEEFDIWGGENLELSFKVWMCGGSLEIIPCSHVGHIFRDKFPYHTTKGSLKRNSVRLAEVWLDEYANFYYQRIGYSKGDYGDISKRRELREKLKCKSFDWYLRNVYPEMKISNKSAAFGQIFNIRNKAVCLDSSSTSSPSSLGTISVLPCHHQGGNQFWLYTEDGKIRFDHLCLDYLFSIVTLFDCQDGAITQVWVYEPETKYIRHMHTKYCLKVARFKTGLQVILERCVGDNSQKWELENFKFDKLSPELQNYAKSHMRN